MADRKQFNMQFYWCFMTILLWDENGMCDRSRGKNLLGPSILTKENFLICKFNQSIIYNDMISMTLKSKLSIIQHRLEHLTLETSNIENFLQKWQVLGLCT